MIDGILTGIGFLVGLSVGAVLIVLMLLGLVVVIWTVVDILCGWAVPPEPVNHDGHLEPGE